MKFYSFTAALAASLFLAALATAPAQARGHKHHSYTSRHHQLHATRVRGASVNPTERCSLDNNGRTICMDGSNAGQSYPSRQSHRASRVAQIDANGNRASGLVTVSTAAGSITVSPSFAPKIVPFVNAVVARGFRGRVHCYASGGHVRGSLHYSGQACDFAQSGWGRTVRPMYRVADLTNQYGLRNGCSFGDCGHIDNGAPLGGNYYAARRHHHRRDASR